MGIISILNKYIGWSCPLFLFKSYVKKQFLFKKTSWSNKRDDETIFVKHLTLASTLYLELKKKFGGEKAFKITREIIISIGCNEQWKHFNSLNLKDKTPMEKLMLQ